MPIHQIYCTHCTHGSSALERREGELAARMLGYSARAGSPLGQDLRKYYRQIERHIYYYLPRDTPAEAKLRQTAATAPRRLIYLPSTGGLQLLAQVCYRPLDTEGRPGSYFAHALFRDEKDGQPPWSPLDCLRLWHAPGWVEEDSPAFSFVLPALFSLDEMLQGRRAAIDDGVLESFLKTPPEGPFDDPCGVIPERWRRKQAEERAAIFGEAFAGLLELLGEEHRRESLLLAAEPSVAALWFYGMIRLLPPGPIRQAISFSTFEPNAERLGTTLAAIEFYDPAKTDLRSGFSRGRGFAVNTFSDRREPLPGAARTPRTEGLYARTTLARLVEQGLAAIDGQLSDMHSVGAARVEDLDPLAGVDRLARQLLGEEAVGQAPRLTTSPADPPSRPTAAPSWPSSPAALRFLGRVLARELGQAADAPARLGAIVGQPTHLPVLKLLVAELARVQPGATSTPAESLPVQRLAAAMQSAVDHLLETLPDERIAALVATDAIGEEAKTGVLLRYVAAHADLPPGCEFPSIEPLLPVLDGDTLLRLYANVAPRHGAAMVAALCRAGRASGENWAPLALVVEAMDEPSLVALHRSLGTAFFRDYPQAERAMAGKLQQVLHSLPRQPQQFSARLDLVLAGEHLLADDRDRQTAAAWASCRRAVLRIGELEGQKSGIFRRGPVDQIEAAVRQMAEAVAAALPSQTFADDRSGSGKQKILRQIARPLLRGRPLLPPVNWHNRALWQKVAWYFERGAWPRAPLARLRPRSAPLRRAWLALGGTAVVAGLIAAGVLWNAGRDRKSLATVSSRPEGESSPARVPDRRSPSKAVAERPSQDSGVSEQDQLAREDVAEAARQAADAELKRKLYEQARQDAERLAAEQQAAEMAALDIGRQAEQKASLPSPGSGVGQPIGRATRETWIAWAEQFAAERAGAWFCEEPCAGGWLAIPGDRLQIDSEPPSLYLGEGKLDFGLSSYLFGGGFEHRAPTTRHEIPALANELGLKSVFVETRVGPSEAGIAVVGVPQELPAEADAQRKAELEQLRQRSRMLTAHLQTYSGRSTPQEKKDEAFAVLRELLGIKIPPVPAKPKRDSEEFRERPETFAEAMREYERKLSARDRAFESVVPKARETIPVLLDRIKRLESESQQLGNRLTAENVEKLSALAAGCRRLTAVVYQDPAGIGVNAPLPMERQEPLVAGEDGQETERTPPPSAFPLPPLQSPSTADKTVIQIDSKPAAGLKPPAIAQIRVLVVGSQGKPLPPSLKEQIVFGCEVMGETAEGSLAAKRLADVDATPTTEVFEGASAVKFRFQFFRRSGNPFDSQHRLMAETPWSDLAIKPKLHYTIKLELGQDQIDLLRGALVKDSDTR